MLHILQQIVNLGTDEGSFSDKKTTRLLNGIALISICITLFCELYILIFVEFFPSGFTLALFSILTFISILLLNHKGLFSFSRIVFVTYINLTALLIHFLMHFSTGAHTMLLGTFAFYVALFQDKKLVFGLSLLTIGIILGSICLQLSPNYEPFIKFDNSQKIPIIIAFFVTAVFLILLITSFLKSNLEHHQKFLEKALADKNVLLQEVHHRVKNNLQVVSSLFNIQKRRLSKEASEANQAIASAQNRIQSMIFIHEELYSTKNVSQIELSSYIISLVNNIKHLYEASIKNIVIETKLTETYLKIDKALSLGLIINEVLTNSLKHAFPDMKGLILIKLQTKHSFIELTIADDGIGMNPDNNTPPEKGLGINLISSLVKQINCKHKISYESGLKHQFVFQND